MWCVEVVSVVCRGSECGVEVVSVGVEVVSVV